jgi:hypothetical protein
MKFLLLIQVLVSAFYQTEANNSYEVLGKKHVVIRTSNQEKTIALHPVKLSSIYLNRTNLTESELDYTKGVTSFNRSFGAVDLGMNSVPVLDQGAEGTCVTFSSIAALDALLKIGDFISPQCALELYLSLGNNYWDGAYDASNIIDPLITYGVVFEKQCDHSYPTPNVSMDPKIYTTKYADPTVLLKHVISIHYDSLNIDQIKEIIDRKHRLIMAFALQDSFPNGFDIAINGVNISGGLWACQQPGSENYCQNLSDSHESVVIGYDDSQQLLKIRNSWSSDLGDEGDFYMTYKFFKIMSLDGNEIYLNSSYMYPVNLTNSDPGTAANLPGVILLGTFITGAVCVPAACLYARKYR